jgi:GTP cyclohydrolase I
MSRADMTHDEARQGIKHAVYDMLTLIEPNPDREGIEDTPKRVAKMYLDELTAGYAVDIPGLFKTFPDEGFDGLLSVKDIPVRSLCEHHMVPIIGYAHIGYFPDGKIVGLSKLPRVVNAYAQRLQVQERLTEQITEAIERHLTPRGTIVVIEAEHLCMSMRGVQAPGTKTVTSAARGLFIEEQGTKDEFLRLLGNGK